MSDGLEPVRLGVVGLGFMGQTHATNAVELGHEVVASTNHVMETERRDAAASQNSNYESTKFQH